MVGDVSSLNSSPRSSLSLHEKALSLPSVIVLNYYYFVPSIDECGLGQSVHHISHLLFFYFNLLMDICPHYIFISEI